MPDAALAILAIGDFGRGIDVRGADLGAGYALEILICE